MRRLCNVALAAFAVAAIYAGPAGAQSSATGQSLLYYPDSRASGMGRAYTALAEGPSAVWWNPGALGNTTVRSVSLMHTKLVPGLADDVYYDYLGYSQPLEGIGGIGGNIIYLTYGKSVAVGDDEVERGTFTSYEIAATGSLGFKVNENFGFGAALKVIYINLAPGWATEDGRPGTGQSFALDVGGLYRLPNPLLSTDALHIALVLTNFGPDVAFIDEGQASPLGRTFKLGLMYQVFNTEQYSLRFTYDFNQPVILSEPDTGFFDRFTDFKRPLFRSIEEPIQNVGGEIIYSQSNILLAGRIGYVYDPQGTIEDYTFGLGFGVGAFKVDWALVPQSVFLTDDVHQFSVTAKF